MVCSLFAVLSVLAGIVGDLRNGSGQLLYGAGLLSSTLSQGLGTCGNLLGTGGNLLSTLVDLGQCVGQAAVDGTNRG